MIRSSRKGSLTGMALEAMITIWSMLATAGRWKALRRGSTSVRGTGPVRLAGDDHPVPHQGGDFLVAELPRARQVTRSPPHWT